MPRVLWLAGMLSLAALGSAPAAPPPPRIPHREFQERVLPLLSRTDEHRPPLVAMWVTAPVMTYILTTDGIDPSPANYLALRFFQRSVLIYLRPAAEEPVAGWDRLRQRVWVRDAHGREHPPLQPPRQLAPTFADADPTGAQALLFPAETPEGEWITAGGALELVVREIGDVPERVFRWRTPIRYPAVAENLLRQLHRRQQETIRRQRIPPEQAVRAALPWLCDVARVADHWLLVAWCPPRWWEAALPLLSAKPEWEQTALQEQFHRSTFLLLFGLENTSPRELRQIARHAVLEDAGGRNHRASEAPGAVQELLPELAGALPVGQDMPARVLVFRDAPPRQYQQDTRLLLQPDAGQPACTVRCRRPPAVPRAVGRLLGWER